MNDGTNGVMDRDVFWNLIHEAKDYCGEDLRASANWIEEQLLFMGARQAKDFHNIFYAYSDHADHYGLWTAANIMCGGLSDDLFMDFRAWLIAQGRETYAAALKDPDTLAGVKPYGDCRFQALAHAGDRAYEGLTGKSLFDHFDKAGHQKLLAEVEAEMPLGDGINYPYDRSDAEFYLPKLCEKYDVSATGSWNYDSPDIKRALKSEKKSSRVKNRGDAR